MIANAHYDGECCYALIIEVALFLLSTVLFTLRPPLLTMFTCYCNWCSSSTLVSFFLFRSLSPSHSMGLYTLFRWTLFTNNIASSSYLCLHSSPLTQALVVVFVVFATLAILALSPSSSPSLFHSRTHSLSLSLSLSPSASSFIVSLTRVTLLLFAKHYRCVNRYSWGSKCKNVSLESLDANCQVHTLTLCLCKDSLEDKCN